MVIDVTTFNGEEELFEIRYHILKDFVDEFRVVEFDQTFSGKPKEFTFTAIKEKYPKVKYCPIDETVWSKYKDLAISSPNTEYGKGAEHLVREFCQKESIKDCLTDLNVEDVLFIGDCDEIWNPKHKYVRLPLKLQLQVYSYYLDNRSNEQFWGTLVVQYKDIKDQCLNHLRSDTKHRTEKYPSGIVLGWHFTSMGGAENVKKKLTDSYTSDSYASPQVISNLESNINANKDFLARDFNYTKDISEWPPYLKDNRLKYLHLLKP